MHNYSFLQQNSEHSTPNNDSKIILFKVKKEKSKKKSNEGRWTYEEHQQFVECLKKFGKNWKQIAAVIKTRSGAQIRSHAQKFFFRLQNQYHQKNKRIQSNINTQEVAHEEKMRNRLNSTDSYSLLENIDNDFYEKLNSMKKVKKDSMCLSNQSFSSHLNNDLQDEHDNANISLSSDHQNTIDKSDDQINYISLLNSLINENVNSIPSIHKDSQETIKQNENSSYKSFFAQILNQFLEYNNKQANLTLSDLVYLGPSAAVHKEPFTPSRKCSFSKFSKSNDDKSETYSTNLSSILANSVKN